MRDKFGKYMFIKKIGRGGMGEVWSAVRRDMMMPCAIKVLHAELAETARDRARFLNEARIAAQLDHGRIVKVIDIGEVRGCPFLVMDWVDGVNLHELVSKAREAGVPRLNLQICCFIIGEVLAALQYAHGRTVAGLDAGVIHYDITPWNVLVSSIGEVRLTDFGIARFAATAERLSRSVGTPRYMSPEQITGHAMRETDIYSLGVLFFELIEGTRYLDGTDSDQFRARVLLGPPAELTRPDVPDWIRRLIRQMLAVRPDDRPSAAEARAMILDNAVGYHAASRKLQSLYNSLVGEPRSGLTQLFESGEEAEQYGVSLADASLRRRSPAIEQASPAQVSTTLTGIPIRGLPAPVQPEPEPEIEPEIEPTIELPMDDLLQPALPRATLPTVAPSHAQPVRDSNSPAEVRVAQYPRWLVPGLAAMVLTLATALVWMSFADREGEGEVETNEVAVSPPSTIIADVSTSPTPRHVEQPQKTEAPPVEAPPVEPPPVEPPPVEPTAIDPPPPPPADPEPIAEPDPKPVPPKAKPPRQQVVFLSRDGKPFELKIGQKVRQVQLAVELALRPGSHAIEWRRSASETWRSCGTLVVDLLEDKQYYDVKVGDGTLSTNVRRRGGRE